MKLTLKDAGLLDRLSTLCDSLTIGLSLVFSDVCVAHLFIFLYCVFCFVCLHSVSCAQCRLCLICPFLIASDIYLQNTQQSSVFNIITK